MTTPQDPNQPQGWGQQQPGPGQQPPQGQPSNPAGQYGQPQPGQPQPGQPQLGQPQGQPPQGQPWNNQQGQPQQGQPWAGANASGSAEPKKNDWKKRLPLVLVLIVVAVGFALFRNGVFASDPEVGDCIRADGTSYETVDCDSGDAEYRIVGTDDDMTQAEFYADPATCADVAAESSGVALWSGSDADGDGNVYCAVSV